MKEFDRGVQADREGKHDEAIEHYQKAVKIAPAFYMAHNNLGSDYLSKSDFSSARNEFQQASQLNQSDGAPYFNLSNVCILDRANCPRPSSIWTRACSASQIPPSDTFCRARLISAWENFPRPKALCTRLFRLDPMMAQARLQLVNLLLQQGRKDDAVAQLHDFVGAFPESPFSGKAKDLLKRLQAQAPDSQPVSK